MQVGQLTFHITMVCAAIKYGCETALRVGARAVEIIQPKQHANGRAYAHMYFKFGSGQPYQVQSRHRLHLPDFTQRFETSCTQWHNSLQQNLPEARIDFGKMRRGETLVALQIYAN